MGISKSNGRYGERITFPCEIECELDAVDGLQYTVNGAVQGSIGDYGAVSFSIRINDPAIAEQIVNWQNDKRRKQGLVNMDMEVNHIRIAPAPGASGGDSEVPKRRWDDWAITDNPRRPAGE